ncbi:MFS transporter [Colwellia sp. 4_MG-2023]|uniref:MFS transporter n=1 Tax=unclassified Colwellia TaxID=196834 RepID=UPI001C095A0B|nr:MULTISPECIES: MFS transporter [unclassified Colwellia]MBU2923956.1 MFS transporter [Colwellia sp. C2M11]MDO6507215.1 MFS transporter [Colwellia sp. 5_MG-2023]MDO6555441.1 MFS transporter [Colwellia sp. 4_MG-2023]MDO6653424.1 MFS transporter [Colwellia sp. 3_MG-2023]MDO6666208.1 MFS transporter [Colwellia sp. 2_MG-2023]
MSTNINKNKLFIACCLALTVTAMTFAIRAGILGQLSQDFSLSDTQLGWINAMAFLGFPVATMLGGLLYNFLGAKKLVLIAFIGHLLGLLLTMNAAGFWTLLISSFCIGFANGSVEAACNPLIADIYHKNKTTMLNRFHVWFPGGVVIGALISKNMTDMSFGWQAQIAVMLVPTIIYGYLIFTQKFPQTTNINTSTTVNIKALFSPLFLFIAFCMTLTTTSELGTQQWIERILGSSGASPMLIMAMITGVMAVGRYFAGPLIHKFNPAGVLLYSAIVTTLGIYSMSIATGNMVYFSALLFALGVTYFWPTMVGFVAENIPKSGALGMSILGGIGMFAVSMWNPIIGSWIDKARLEALAVNSSPELAELAAGQATLANLSIFPFVLIFAFTALVIFMRKSTKATEVTRE